MTLSRCLNRLSHAQNPWSATIFRPWDTFPVPNVQNPWSAHCPTVPVYAHGGQDKTPPVQPPTPVTTLDDLLAALQTGLVFHTPGAQA